ncbi:MAG: NAD(P)-dependent glycerol-3-phosphate dehydrogenase [Candidatus Omnitrophica bacterium]|nr:NAD(P)-dependent glycerol-3-phosphate dehydrogenase [Candidatus Omnitrophota bacterium]
MKHISIIGDGGWGTTLAVHLAKKNYSIKLWGAFAPYVAEVSQTRINSKFLPGIRLPVSIELSSDLKYILSQSDLWVFAVPSKYAADVLKQIKSSKINLHGKTIVSVTKGLDTKTLKRMSEIIADQLQGIQVAVLSGPTIAMEVAQGIPSTAVVASKKLSTAKAIQEIFNSSTFRIYTNTDVIGVELGGTVKNIIAIACGVCDGLKFGTNTKSAIVTRGLAEMSRLGKAMGAKQRTLIGLTGLGDLVTTCFSPRSRNRTFGEQLGSGKKAKDILASMEMVAEGAESVQAVHKLSQKLDVSMPITTEVFNIVYKDKNPMQAVTDLMTRKTKSE